MKSFLQKISSFITTFSFKNLSLRNKILIAVGLVVLLFGGWSAFQAATAVDGTLLTVTKGEFIQRVSVSGKVVATNDVDLGFSQSGRVESLSVDVNDAVTKGQLLGSLSFGTLLAELQSAQAQLRIKQVEYENTGINLDEVRKQQDTAVASARRALLSSALVAVPESTSYGLTPPTLSGVYLGEDEGVYRITIEPGVQHGANFKLSYFGIETATEKTISEKQPTPLGTKGLYVSFPEGVSTYSGTRWRIELPNKSGSSYVSNYNAYQEALRARDKAVSDAEAQLRERSQGATIAAATLDAARAEVTRIQALIAERQIFAPFKGIVSKVPVSVGETVGANEPVVSLIGEGLFIETYVPEINISLVSVGNPASVTFDAYGDSVPFAATVVSIDPDETLRDGVATYKVKLHLDGADDRIRSGMTANVVVTTEQKSGVIAVPQGIVKGKGAEKTIQVVKNGKKETRKITTGGVSALGDIEVLSGLSEGETVVLTK